MPIADNRNVIVEFEWTTEDESERYYVKHHSVDGVPTVSFSNDGENWFNLPFLFFTEVVDEINQKNAQVRRMPPQPKRTPLRTSVLPQSDGSVAVVQSGDESEAPQTGLPLPMIQRKLDANGTLEPMEVADIDPLESFAGLGALVAKTADRPTTARKQRQKQAEEEIISRPVIRGADEATSRMMRGGGNEAKAVRPAHV